MMVIKTAHDNGKGIDGNAIIDGNGIIDGKWCAVCVCCGPDSVPPRSLPKYFMQSKAKDDTEVCASSDPIWVHCSNMKCQLPPQKFECFMEFLDVINGSQYVPKKLLESDLFLKNATPHYQRHRNGKPPSSDIYLPHCIGCSLSALINVGTKVTMQNVPHPLPLPHPGTISESTLNNIAEPDDDDQNNDNDNNHHYEYVDANNVAVAQKANDNDLIAPACPTCPRKKNRLQDVAIDNNNDNNNNNHDNDNDNNYDNNNYKIPNTKADNCLDNDFVYANGLTHSTKRKQMNSMSSKSRKKSVTSSMSRRESVAYTANVMKNLPPANNGIDNMKYLQGYYSARLTITSFSSDHHQFPLQAHIQNPYIVPLLSPNIQRMKIFGPHYHL